MQLAYTIMEAILFGSSSSPAPLAYHIRPPPNLNTEDKAKYLHAFDHIIKKRVGLNRPPDRLARPLTLGDDMDVYDQFGLFPYKVASHVTDLFERAGVWRGIHEHADELLRNAPVCPSSALRNYNFLADLLKKLYVFMCRV